MQYGLLTAILGGVLFLCIHTLTSERYNLSYVSANGNEYIVDHDLTWSDCLGEKFGKDPSWECRKQ